MSTTSLIYHAFGVRGYRVRRTEYVGGEVHVTIEQPDSKLRCSVCRSRRVIRRGGRTRRFRGLPIGPRRVWFVLLVPWLECKHCGVVRQAEIPFAPGQHSYTKRFARYVVELARCMTIGDVAEHLAVSWNVVKETPEGGAPAAIPATAAERSSTHRDRRDLDRQGAPLSDSGAGS